MSEYPLNEKQKNLLREIHPKLKDKTMGTDAMLMSSYGGKSITFVGKGFQSFAPEGWKNIDQLDIDKFTKFGFLIPQGSSSFTVDDYLVIEAVEKNFLREASNIIVEKERNSVKDPRAVFVVHGRNEPIRVALFDFLRSIGLDPLEWDDLVSRTNKGTPYIGEVLDTAFSEAQAVVVLLTPDDLAFLRVPFQQEHDEAYEKNLTPQARPNVLFEAGMAMAWLAHGSKFDIDNGLKRAYFHAHNLGLSDENIVGRLEELMNIAKGFTDVDWTEENRRSFLDKVERIRNDSARIVQGKQRGFKSDPD